MLDTSVFQDPVVMQGLANMAVSLSTLAAKGTASAVATRVASIKEMKSTEAVRNAYEELISELLDERAEAIRIAQAYKDELDRVQISDEDIKSLNSTIGRLLDAFGLSSEVGEGENGQQLDSQRLAINALKQLISADTLRTMQLLGFNFKAAIGQPLTELCAARIRQLGDTKATVGGNRGKNRGK